MITELTHKNKIKLYDNVSTKLCQWSGVHSISSNGVFCRWWYLPWLRYTLLVVPARFRRLPAVLISGHGSPDTQKIDIGFWIPHVPWWVKHLPEDAMWSAMLTLSDFTLYCVMLPSRVPYGKISHASPKIHVCIGSSPVTCWHHLRFSAISDLLASLISWVFDWRRAASRRRAVT